MAAKGIKFKQTKIINLKKESLGRFVVKSLERYLNHIDFF